MDQYKKSILSKKAQRINLILLDVDGTFTDGQLIFGPNGEICKSFNIKDGMGIHLAQQEGIQIGLISGRYSEIVQKRADELKIKFIWQGVQDKLSLFRELLGELGLLQEEVAFIGDDINDLPLLREVGFSAAVADAVKEVRIAVDYVTKKEGGRGAIREFIDFIRKLKDSKPSILPKPSKIDKLRG